MVDQDHYDVCVKETKDHIERVRVLTHRLSEKIKLRGIHHDASKLLPPEVDILAEHNHKLLHLTYNSPEYKANLEVLKPALDHHYANNRHHPQHYPNGISGMNLVDIVEMLCDWKASCERHIDGNILRSIEENVERFKISPDLAAVLRNTAELLEL